MRDVLKKYFDVNIFILKVAGVWVPSKYKTTTTKALHNVYNISVLVFCVCIYQPAESAVLFLNFEPIVFVRCLRDQLNHFFCIYKLLLWFRKRKTIVNIMNSLQGGEFVYENCSDFRPEEIMERYKLQSDRWAKMFLFGVNFICFNMFLSVAYVFVFESDGQYRVTENGNLIYDQKLPVNLRTPFSKSTKLGFMLHFIFEIVALDVYGWGIIGK